MASAELISKPVSLVSMVRTGGRGGKDREFRVEGLGTLRGNAGTAADLSPHRSGARPHLRWGPAPAGSPPPCSPRLPRLPLGKRRRKRRRRRVGAGPGAEGRSDAARRALTGGQDLQDHHQICHVVPRRHRALLVGAHLANLLDLLVEKKNPKSREFNPRAEFGGGQHRSLTRPGPGASSRGALSPTSALTTSNVPGATIKLSMTLLILVTSDRMEAWEATGQRLSRNTRNNPIYRAQNPSPYPSNSSQGDHSGGT